MGSEINLKPDGDGRVELCSSINPVSAFPSCLGSDREAQQACPGLTRVFPRTAVCTQLQDMLKWICGASDFFLHFLTISAF